MVYVEQVNFLFLCKNIKLFFIDCQKRYAKIMIMKRKILAFFLKRITHGIIGKYQPKIIAITGSTGKTSAKNAIYTVLSTFYNTRKSEENLNTEFGLPLAFIGGINAKNSLGKWLKNIFKGLKLLIIKDKNYPRFIIVEMGADKPRDIQKLLKIAKPNVSVVTAIGSIPVHLENYQDIDELIFEKSQIVRILNPTDFAILNIDEENIKKMEKVTQAKVLFFGFNENADLRISDFKLVTKTIERGFEIPLGIRFNLNYQGEQSLVFLKNHLGMPSAYAASIGAAVGLIFDIPLSEISKALEKFIPEKGRMNLIEGIKNSLIIDDSYNASPLAVKAALSTLKDIPALRKIVVLGDMLELGNYSQKAHEEIGKLASQVADYLFLVGPRMVFAKEEALNNGFDKNKIFYFNDSSLVAEKLIPLINEHDLILVKGSQAMRMEKIIKEIMKEPQKAKELLVRQSREWQNNSF